jgi:hypothetical protein
LPPAETIGLHGFAMEVPLNTRPVIPRERALTDYGIPADVLLVMRFPFDEQAQLAKEVALVDYGQDVNENNKVPYTLVRRDLDAEIELVGDRYGLRPLNYAPYGPSAGHVPVRPDTEVMIGTALLSAAGGHLGMWGRSNVGNTGISPVQITVQMRGDWFVLSDQSAAGTQVVVSTVPPDRER